MANFCEKRHFKIGTEIATIGVPVGSGKWVAVEAVLGSSPSGTTTRTDVRQLVGIRFFYSICGIENKEQGIRNREPKVFEPLVKK